MLKIENYYGVKYNNLTILKWTGKKYNSDYIVECLCDCGKTKEVLLNNIRRGNTKTCRRCNNVWIEHGDYYECKIVSENKSFIIDKQNYSEISKHQWHLSRGKYVISNIKGSHKLLHRVIMGYDGDKDIDHINSNPLDNRRNNLRVCNRSQNNMNIGIRSTNTSNVTGVSWSKKDKVWHAYINFNYKRINLGYYKNKEDAVIARKNAEKKYHGEFRSIKESR